MKPIKPEDVPRQVVDAAAEYWAGDDQMHWCDEEWMEFRGLLALVINTAAHVGVLPGGSQR